MQPQTQLMTVHESTHNLTLIKCAPMCARITLDACMRNQQYALNTALRVLQWKIERRDQYPTVPKRYGLLLTSCAKCPRAAHRPQLDRAVRRLWSMVSDTARWFENIPLCPAHMMTHDEKMRVYGDEIRAKERARWQKRKAKKKERVAKEGARQHKTIVAA